MKKKLKRRTYRQVSEAIYDAYEPYCLSKRLFQCNEPGNELIDFELSDYTRFLDKVSSLRDLVEGLYELSPFADDALDMAESMNDLDFSVFKLALVNERKIASFLKDCDFKQMVLVNVTGEEIPASRMPPEFGVLLLPSRFIRGQMLAQQVETSLVLAMERIMGFESETAHIK